MRDGGVTLNGRLNIGDAWDGKDRGQGSAAQHGRMCIAGRQPMCAMMATVRWRGVSAEACVYRPFSKLLVTRWSPGLGS